MIPVLVIVGLVVGAAVVFGNKGAGGSKSSGRRADDAAKIIQDMQDRDFRDSSLKGAMDAARSAGDAAGRFPPQP